MEYCVVFCEQRGAVLIRGGFSCCSVWHAEGIEAKKNNYSMTYLQLNITYLKIIAVKEVGITRRARKILKLF